MNVAGNKLFAQILERLVQPARARQSVFLNAASGTSISWLYFTTYFWRLSRVSSKLGLLQLAWNDPMLPEGATSREALLGEFGRAQQVYHALARFAHQWRLRRANIVVDRDMQLNPIAEGDRQIICIYHQRHKYLFNVHELLRQINVYLGNSFMFHSEPLHIKNPYNNVPFPKSVLYHLYLHLMLHNQWGSLRRFESSLFAKFCRCEFDLHRFEWECEPALRDRAIEAHLANSATESLYYDVRSMLTSFNQDCLHRRDRILVDQHFPEEELVEIMRPYLRLEYRRCFSLTTSIRNACKRELRVRLEQFQRFNPNFGTMRYRLKYARPALPGTKFQATTEKVFDKRHAPWYVFDRETFLSSHLLEGPAVPIMEEGGEPTETDFWQQLFLDQQV